jgi:hypothetical protein
MEDSLFMEEAMEAWEGEGGAPSPMDRGFTTQGMTGTPGQIEWAEQIRLRVSAEFDRVAKAFKTVAGNQAEQARMETNAVIAILEEKRGEVMAKDRAGYFIRDWQELRDQVRQMIAQDPRYQAIKANQAARQR